jgi:oligopeptide/dipeptide ABC transporter ATP-binding protein
MERMLSLDRISKSYKTGTFGGKDVLAVRDVTFDVQTGEVVSLIGESGSGKTTIGKMILKLIDISRGTITLDGKDVSQVRGGAVRAYYRHVQGVFQDPFSSYNPIFKADRVFAMIHSEYFPQTPASEWSDKLDAALRSVTLDPGQVLNKYPHQLSGGQLQRLLVARALLLDLKVLVADEIISMLDASTRIDVLNLLADLKTRGMGILFITHDLSLGNYISEKTVILRRGAVVEMGDTDTVFGHPTHPYTRLLVSSVPQLHKKWAEIEAELSAPIAGKGGCPFHDAYPLAGRLPDRPADEPTLVQIEEDHFVGCFELESEKAKQVA